MEMTLKVLFLRPSVLNNTTLTKYFARKELFNIEKHTKNQLLDDLVTQGTALKK